MWSPAYAYECTAKCNNLSKTEVMFANGCTMVHYKLLEECFAGVLMVFQCRYKANFILHIVWVWKNSLIRIIRISVCLNSMLMIDCYTKNFHINMNIWNIYENFS